MVQSFSLTGGEGGIRTPGTLRYNGFQDRRFRPLSHLSRIPAVAQCAARQGFKHAPAHWRLLTKH